MTEEEICKKVTCIQHCCPYEYFLESATNECKSAKLSKSSLQGSDDGIFDYDYQDGDFQYDEHEEWFGNWNNEAHEKVLDFGHGLVSRNSEGVCRISKWKVLDHL